ncbi:MAG: tail fiber domain-containing protein [Lachnospiraceae bacterium]|nr:tail fiber domain-containing protein [Lachnospiraceae bacterium]
MRWFNTKYRQSDTRNSTASFVHNRNRENIKSGEKHSTLFGKIARYFADLKTVAFTGSYNDLTGKPQTMPPSSHSHTKSQISDFPSSLPASDVKAWAKAANKPSYNWSEIGSKPGSFPPSSHSHDSYAPKADPVFTGTVKIGSFTIGGISLKVGNDTGNSTVLRAGGTNTAEPAVIYRQFTNDFQVLPTKRLNGQFGDNNANILGMVAANNIYNSSGLITSSDRNKKKDFADITQEFADSVINGLVPVSFKYKDGASGRRHYGMVAQDVEDLLKTLNIDTKDFSPLVKEYPQKTEKRIEKDKDGNETENEYLTTDYDAVPGYYLRYEGFIGLVIKYIQGLDKKNNALEKRIADLEEIINSRA